MRSPPFAARMPYLIAGVSLLGLFAGSCNKQPSSSATEAAMVAPPAATLPMADTAPAPAAPAPVGAALPRPATPVAYSPQQAGRRYGYVDRAYSMAQAFGDTPPDYTVDYEGTRPWIWRADNGAYRIVERLPRGERYYYYEPGEDYPFLVQDPDYSYAYDREGLTAVYDPDGADLADVLAARRADEASRYLYRARQLYRAAQYEQRQSAYANEWATRRDDLRAQDLRWRQQQTRNADWRAWHDAHEAQEQQRWRAEQDRRTAYATAIGIAGPALLSRSQSPGAAPPALRPAELARRQASYFSNWNASHAQARASTSVASRSNPAVSPQKGALPAAVQSTPTPVPHVASAQRTEAAAAAQARIAQAKAAEASAAQAKAADVQRREAAAAQAKVARAKATEASAAQAKAADAQRREAAAAQARLAQAKAAEASAAQAKAADLRHRETATARARLPEAQRAQQLTARAKQGQVAAMQAKAVQPQRAQQSAAKTKPHEAAPPVPAKIVQTRSGEEAKAAQARATEAKAAQAKEVQAREADARIAQVKQNGAGKLPASHKRPNAPKDREHDKPQ